jgi:hypothetical protein
MAANSMKAIVSFMFFGAVFYAGQWVGSHETEVGRYQLTFNADGIGTDRKVDTATGRYWEKLNGTDHWLEMGTGLYDKHP